MPPLPCHYAFHDTTRRQMPYAALIRYAAEIFSTLDADICFFRDALPPLIAFVSLLPLRSFFAATPAPPFRRCYAFIIFAITPMLLRYADAALMPPAAASRLAIS